jgi:hypothetical protein
MSNFNGARAKLTIGSLDDSRLAVEAQYNPKELQIDKPVQWSEKPQATLEFLDIQSRTLTVELLFDCYELQADGDIVELIATLEKLSSPHELGSNIAELRRPHHCIVLWGEAGMPKMRCVIEKLATKYIVWSEDGKPLRATCTVSLKEFRLDPDALAKQGARQIADARRRASKRAGAEQQR